jgi:diguanylate cyclase (GGDEF)-like protein/PAS domain S-box-containing protein
MLLAWGTILLTAGSGYISTIWPADALLLALILPIRARRWPPFLVMGLLGNILANLFTYGGLIASTLYSLSNMVGIVIAALLLQRGESHGNMLENVRAVLRFVLIGGILAPAASSVGGALTAHHLFGQPLLPSYSTWYVANALGLLIFTPLFSGIVSGAFSHWLGEMSPAARIEAAGIFALVILCGLFTFLVAGYPMLFLLAPPVLLATFRLGQFGAKISLIIAALIGVVCTMYGHGPIAAIIPDKADQALFLQFYLAVLLLMTLPVTADLNARRTLARRLAESEASLRLLASESADALVRLDDRGHCIQSSGATTRLLGVEAGTLSGSLLATLADERTEEAVVHSIAEALASPDRVSYCEFRPRHRPESWLECTIRALVGQDGWPYGAIGAIRDITMRKEREISLALAASTDSLTGALNHAAFMTHLHHALAYRTGGHLALLMIDIDHFKQVNDQYGHPIGDVVLVELHSRLRALVRDHDAIGRLGGDEIGILLEGATEAAALAIAEAIRAIIAAKPIILGDGIEHSISISCGVADAYPGISRDELLRRADEALYLAKGGGRDRVVISAV